jgi:hypothetical protein
VCSEEEVNVADISKADERDGRLKLRAKLGTRHIDNVVQVQLFGNRAPSKQNIPNMTETGPCQTL